MVLDLFLYHPSQDSLSFIGKTSSYNLNENIIKLKEVVEIFVAADVVNPTEDFIIEKDEDLFQQYQM